MQCLKCLCSAQPGTKNQPIAVCGLTSTPVIAFHHNPDYCRVIWCRCEWQLYAFTLGGKRQMLVGVLCRVWKGYMCPYCWHLYSECVVLVQVNWNWNWNKIKMSENATLQLSFILKFKSNIWCSHDLCQIWNIFEPKENIEYWCTCKNSQWV